MRERTKTGAAFGSGAARAAVTAMLLAQGVETPPTQAQINCGLMVTEATHDVDLEPIYNTFSGPLKQSFIAFRQEEIDAETFVARCLTEVASASD